MAETTHHGGCHCGAVRFTVELDTSTPSIICNCSICARSGSMLQFVTPDKFTLEQGEANLTEYKFNKHAINHLFCKTCGIKSFARGKGKTGDMVAVNARCLDGIDVFAAPTKQVDGKSF